MSEAAALSSSSSDADLCNGINEMPNPSPTCKYAIVGRFRSARELMWWHKTLKKVDEYCNMYSTSLFGLRLAIWRFGDIYFYLNLVRKLTRLGDPTLDVTQFVTNCKEKHILVRNCGSLEDDVEFTWKSSYPFDIFKRMLCRFPDTYWQMLVASKLQRSIKKAPGERERTTPPGNLMHHSSKKGSLESRKHVFYAKMPSIFCWVY